MVERSKTRRQFGAWLLEAGWWSLAIAALGGVVATVRFFIPRALFEPPVRFIAGRPSDYAAGQVSERFADEHKVWLVRDDGGIFALVAQCTHLGCRPRWFPEEVRFKCPCHGSNFDRDGRVISGPAPKPLLRAGVSLKRDGRILVNRGVIVDLVEAERRPGYRISTSALDTESKG